MYSKRKGIIVSERGGEGTICDELTEGMGKISNATVRNANVKWTDRLKTITESMCMHFVCEYR